MSRLRRRLAGDELKNVRVRGGSYQVRVYAGPDPVTGKPKYISESTRDPRQIRQIRTKLQAQVDQQRSAATNATLSYTIDRWLEVAELDFQTRLGYEGYIRRNIRPALGHLPISKIKPQVLESFYAQLRRCRLGCDGRPFVEHRIDGPHECREVQHRRPRHRPPEGWIEDHDCTEVGCIVVECKKHVCKPLASSTVRQIHAIISSALDAATRWGWVPVNVARLAKKPRQEAPRPRPPSPSQAADIINAAWAADEDWGTLIWTVMVNGPRRGEVLALRVRDVLFEEGVLVFEHNYFSTGGRKGLKDTKTHQMRRPAQDEATLAILGKHVERIKERCEALGVPMTDDKFLFSYKPDHSEPANPDGVTRRFHRMCSRLGIDCHMHALRHYSATELIRAGVDIRTVAGRLGHGGGGTTTLRVYAAWVAESDRRAAGLLAERLPRPGD